MGQPWGLSGPQFTWLYIGGFVVAMVIVFAVQAALSRAGSRSAGRDARLDVYQAAYLAGGPARVVDTVIAGLALRDQILVARSGRLTAVNDAVVHGPIESAVYRALHPTASRTAVQRRLRGEPSIVALDDQVRSRGLLLDEARRLLWRLVVFVPIAVWLVGLVRAINGAQLHRPIGNLTGLLVVTAFVTAFLLIARVRSRYRPSAAGLFALRRVRDQYQAGAGLAGGPRGSALAPQLTGVAVLGFAAIADPQLRGALGGSSGSGGDSGGGDSGGGGCGGGGCGG